MKYASGDLETTGLIAGIHQITEIAIVVDDLNEPKPILELPFFTTYVSHKHDLLWSMGALLMFKGRLEEYDKAIKTPVDDVVDVVTRFLADNFIPLGLRSEHRNHELDLAQLRKQKVTFAGKNFASFDRSFLNVLPNSEELMRVIHHRCFDPCSLYFGLQDNVLPSTETCKQRAGISGGVSHRALDDARDVVRLIRAKHGISIL